MHRVNHISAHVVPVSLSAAKKLEAAPDTKELVITVVGAGNSGHVTCALLEENFEGRAERVRVQLLTSTPNSIRQQIEVRFPDGTTQSGRINAISNDAEELIPQSDLVLWTGPVSGIKQFFEQIRPFVDVKRTAIGTVFTQGLMHVLAARLFGPHVKFFALRNIPWLCRTTERGVSCEIVGTKSSIEAMCINLDAEYMKRVVEPMFVTQRLGRWEPTIEMMKDFCPIVFNPANQIIHPARYWGMFRKFTGTPLKGDDTPPEWLYRGMDEVSGVMLELLDEELQSLKDAYFRATQADGCLAVIPLRDRLLAQYGSQISDTSTLAKMVGTNAAYALAKTPVVHRDGGVCPHPTHRVVVDDIGWGLCVLLSIAERLEREGVRCPTTTMRAMVEWHQVVMGKEFLVNGRLIGRDCTELVLLGPYDSVHLVANVPTGGILKQSIVITDEEDFRIGNP